MNGFCTFAVLFLISIKSISGSSVFHNRFNNFKNKNSSSSVLLGRFDNPNDSFVAAMIAYYFSLDDLGPLLRAQLSAPKAALDYVTRLAYVRQGGTDKAIWSGLNPALGGPRYGWAP